jgi:hypothetical protein
MVIPGSNCYKNTWRTLSNIRTCPNINSCGLRLMLNLGPPFGTVRCSDWYWPPWKKARMPNWGVTASHCPGTAFKTWALLSYLITKWEHERQQQQAESATLHLEQPEGADGFGWARLGRGGANEGMNTNNERKKNKTRQDTTFINIKREWTATLFDRKHSLW